MLSNPDSATIITDQTRNITCHTYNNISTKMCLDKFYDHYVVPQLLFEHTPYLADLIFNFISFICFYLDSRIMIILLYTCGQKLNHLQASIMFQLRL